jgi:signal peptidase I
MNNRRDRKTRKYAREILRGGRKWLRINRDLLSANQQSDIRAKSQQLQQALRDGPVADAAARSDELERKIQSALPAQKHSAVRENVEVLLVAAILAMGVRTFFIQPFKIPTGSMQPTLYGIYPPPESPSHPYNSFHGPSFLERVVGMLFQGNMYEEDGYRSRGDHIFVDKFSYHFRKPRRGEVIVFDTSFIDKRYFNRREDAYYDRVGRSYERHLVHGPDTQPQVVSSVPEDCNRINARGGFYIKRLVGLGGDHLEIQPPFLYVNGAVLDDRPAFQRIYSREDQYSGYVLQHYQPRNVRAYEPQFLNDNLSNAFTVPPRNIFVLGDNSLSSLDGRFWGPIPHAYLVGRAVLVYWPFSKRFGLID